MIFENDHIIPTPYSAAESLRVLMETDNWKSNYQSLLTSSSDLGVNNVRAITWEAVRKVRQQMTQK